MTIISQSHLEAYSQGKMTRKEISAAMGQPVGFGELFAQLSERDLNLPKLPSNPEAVGFVRKLLRQSTDRPLGTDHGR